MSDLDIANRIRAEIADCYWRPLRFVLINYPWGVKGTRLANETGPDEWQTEILEDLEDELLLRQTPEGRAKAVSNAIQIAVASGHGIGKTTLIAWIIHWFVSTRPHCQVIATSNTEAQLSTRTWRELNKWHNMAMNQSDFTWTKTRFYFNEYPETWTAEAQPWSETRPESMAGKHEENVLIIFDEASAIPDIIWETVSGSLTQAGAIWIAFGNPTRNVGYFRECFRKYRHRWITRQIDSRTAKMTDKKQIQQWLEDYGEESDFFKIRVKGVFPSAASGQLISYETIEKCLKYKAVGFEEFGKVVGVDVARFGDDQTVIGCRQGRKVWPPKKYRGLSNMAVAREVRRIFLREKADWIFVDGIGVGAGVVDILRDWGLPVMEVQSADRKSLSRPFEYYNMRAEMYGECAKAMEKGIELPPDKDLETQLQQIEYFHHGDLLQIIGKADIKKELGESPDVADWLAITYAYPVTKNDFSVKFTKKAPKGHKDADGVYHATKTGAARWTKKR